MFPDSVRLHGHPARQAVLRLYRTLGCEASELVEILDCRISV